MMPTNAGAGKDRRPALDGTRAAVAEWLGVEPDAFEVETG